MRTDWRLASVIIAAVGTAATACARSPAGDSDTPQPGLPSAPGSAVVAVSRAALDNEGRVVSSYDPASDHTTTAFLAPVDTPVLAGLHLYSYFVHPGTRPERQVSDVYLGVVSIAGAPSLNQFRDVVLTVDGRRREFPCSYGFTRDDNRMIELLLVSNTLTRAEAAELAASSRVDVRLGQGPEFGWTAEHLRLMRELVSRIPQ